MSQITPLIQRLDAWLLQNCPDYYASLGRGATDEQIRQFEEDTQISLPAELAEVYRWKNGANSLVPGELWMPLELVAEECKWREGYTAGESFGELQPWHPEFLPFLTNGGGDFYCFDSVGVWNGAPGQIVHFCHDYESSIVAPGLEAWLEVIVQCHESGCWIREQNQEFADFEQSDGWSATFYKISKTVMPGFPKEEVWAEA